MKGLFGISIAQQAEEPILARGSIENPGCLEESLGGCGLGKSRLIQRVVAFHHRCISGTYKDWKDPESMQESNVRDGR